MELMEKTVESRVLFEGKIITVRLDKAELPNGRVASREVVEHPGGVAILPLFDDGTVSLVRQFRYPFQEVVAELPAGKLERGEDHRLAALRELEEEVGASCGRLTYLGCLYSSPGFSSEVLHMYLAQELTEGACHPDEDEFLSVERIPFSNLSKEGYETLEAYDGEAGLQLALEQNPDLILLDLMLPKMNGFDVCRSLRRENRSTPVIMLTAREEETDKVLGLELGADDYITKPFSMRELLARVKANIRRNEMVGAAGAAAPLGGSRRIEHGRIVIDVDLMIVYKDDHPLELTQREYELLKFLASQPGKVFSREALMEHVWNYEGYVGDVRAVDVAVRRLREKVEDNPAVPQFIVTRRGLGYYFNA